MATRIYVKYETILEVIGHSLPGGYLDIGEDLFTQVPGSDEVSVITRLDEEVCERVTLSAEEFDKFMTAIENGVIESRNARDRMTEKEVLANIEHAFAA